MTIWGDMMSNLIPCPFCGGNAEATIGRERYCANFDCIVAEVSCSCGAKISRRILDDSSYDVVDKTFAGIIKQWNSRYNITPKDLNTEAYGEWTIHPGGEFSFYCSNCNYESDADKLSKYCPNCGVKMEGVK